MKNLIASILISITFLALYILFCEFLHIPLTSDTGPKGGAGLFFQLGIITYSGLLIGFDTVFSRTNNTGKTITSVFSLRDLIPALKTTFCLTIIFAISLLFSWLIISIAPVPSTTELFFDYTGDDIRQPSEGIIPVTISVVNHEGKSAIYNLSVNIPKQKPLYYSLQLTDGQKYSQEIPALTKSGVKKNDILLSVSLDYPGSSTHPYRKIWMRI